MKLFPVFLLLFMMFYSYSFSEDASKFICTFGSSPSDDFSLTAACINNDKYISCEERNVATYNHYFDFTLDLVFKKARYSHAVGVSDPAKENIIQHITLVDGERGKSIIKKLDTKIFKEETERIWYAGKI